MEILRQQIRMKSRELTSLFRTANPDRGMIEKKIDEIRGLEAALDKKTNFYGDENRGNMNLERAEGFHDSN